jgi:hypothetical protein
LGGKLCGTMAIPDMHSNRWRHGEMFG